MIQRSEKTPPDILEEEESPPFHESEKQRPPLSKEDGAGGPIDLKKFSLGSTTLRWCILLMFLCIVLSIWNQDNELIKSGFEAFKLIVMTILGYIFGSNSANRE